MSQRFEKEVQQERLTFRSGKVEEDVRKLSEMSVRSLSMLHRQKVVSDLTTSRT